MDAEWAARLDALERKLDYVVDRQRYAEELVEELTPVAREALTAMSGPLASLEERGYFRLAQKLGVLADRVITDDGMEPVGVAGLMAATRDPEVQRGMAVVLELLRLLGSPQGHAVPAPQPTTTALAPPPRAPVASAPAPPVAEEVVMWEGHAFSSAGFLVDPATWTEDLAVKMAAGLGVTLSDDHWLVIRWARADYLEHGAAPNVRRVASGSGVGTRRMYELFPKSPGKTTAMLAGIPKPVGCV